MVAPMDARLTPKDWVVAGLRLLATQGPGALKVGAMATRLGVSRGSFYWHFRDFADFRSQLLDNWRDRTVDQIIREFESNPEAPDRLQQLVKKAFFGRRGLDRAIRTWAATEPEVQAMVAAVDARRVGYMAELLISAGVDADQAEPRAAFLYWAYLGQAIVMDPATAVIDEAALRRVTALFEA
jgi:AcrR family transcriptional regulator